MAVRWEFYADTDGALIVERFEQGWRFEPNRPVGRPKADWLLRSDPRTLWQALPSGIQIERLTLNGQEVRAA